MISTGATAPDFVAKDQDGNDWRLRDHLKPCVDGMCLTRNVMILGYPRDWTPTCSSEVPELNAMAERFLAEANTTVVALNTDSFQSHKRWCESVGGCDNLAVLSDAMPHGRISKAYGMWIPRGEVTDRATVIVGSNGRILYAASVGEFGRRNMYDLLDVAKRVTGNATAPAAAVATPMLTPGLPILFIAPFCGACAPVKQYISANPRVRARLQVVDVAGPGASAIMRRYKITGTPTLVINDQKLVGPTPVLNALRQL